MIIRQTLRLSAALALLLSVGCATQHQVTESHQAQEAPGIERIAVVVTSPDAAERQTYENAISQGLAAKVEELLA